MARVEWRVRNGETTNRARYRDPAEPSWVCIPGRFKDWMVSKRPPPGCLNHGLRLRARSP
jgi:hypothetical protein